MSVPFDSLQIWEAIVPGQGSISAAPSGAGPAFFPEQRLVFEPIPLLTMMPGPDEPPEGELTREYALYFCGLFSFFLQGNFIFNLFFF